MTEDHKLREIEKSENFCQGLCGRPRDEHEYLDVSNMTRLYVCPTAERAAKWKPVEPGMVIPAGQPYRVEPESPTPTSEFPAGHPEDWHASTYPPVFVDSSWRPEPVRVPADLIDALAEALTASAGMRDPAIRLDTISYAARAVVDAARNGADQ